MSIINAQARAIAGFTNTGAIHIAGIDALPSGFPALVAASQAWTKQHFGCCAEETSTFIYSLSIAEVAEVKDGLLSFKELGLDGTRIHKTNFILPTLGNKLLKISNDVHQGRGFAVLRGLDPDDFTIEDLTLIYIGISTYIGDQIGRQDRAGNCLVHIVADKDNCAHHRHSTDPITFHTEESGEIVSWLTRGTAAEGGKCVLASAGTIYNILAATRPDLIRILAASNWPFALPRYRCRPVIFHEDGKLIINFGRAALMGSAANPRNPRLPVLNELQKEALDAIEAIARATEFQFATKPGDIHFINNMSVLHRRDGFANGPNHERHLVRMRMYDSVVGSSVPDAMEHEFQEAFGKDGDRVFHIEPMPTSFFPLRMYPN